MLVATERAAGSRSVQPARVTAMYGSYRVIDNAQRCSAILVALHHCSPVSLICEEQSQLVPMAVH